MAVRSKLSDSRWATIPARRGASHYASWLALLVGGVAALTTYAGNLTFLNDSPISYFKPEDTDLMMENARKVLDSSDPAAKQSWSNPKTGASGLAQVRGQFKASDGAPCKRLRVMNKMQNLQSDATYTVCKYPDRGWIINTDAQPAGG